MEYIPPSDEVVDEDAARRVETDFLETMMVRRFNSAGKLGRLVQLALNPGLRRVMKDRVNRKI